MSAPGFIHLRVHSAFSLSEGAIHIKRMVDLCRTNRMPAVAITDSGNLFGALEFSETMAGAGIQPIIGCVLALGGDKQEAAAAAICGPDRRSDESPAGLLLLAQNDAGYANLLKLSSASYLETDPGETPQVSLSKLADHSDGLICLSGGPEGPVCRLLADGQKSAAKALVERLAGEFQGRFYIELQRHGTPVEEGTEADLIAFALELDLPMVATNDCYFAERETYEAHDALLCIAGRTTVGQQNRRRLTPEHHFKSAEQMRELFADIPEAVDNTLVIAQRCAFRVRTCAPILPRYDDPNGRDEETIMREMALAGLEERLTTHVLREDMDEAAREVAIKPYRERLDFELDMICRMGFPGYFLIVADFIQWAKQNDIPVGPGRGSGAGSVVAWALKITDLDPLRFALLFERFLNPDRVSMPDFDIDFCQDRRDRVIHYVQDKYGHDQVAQIITFGKLQARAVLRDVGRVLEMPFGQVDRLCKMVPNNPANPSTLTQAVEGEPRLREAIRTEEGVDRLFDIAMKLEGLYRHASTHAAGVVIGDRRLEELVPLYRDPNSDMPVTQFNMKWVEQAGLVKFDFLGLKTLTVLKRTVELLRRRGIDLDLEQLPLEDEATYAMLQRGETVGVFQFEGSGMRDLLKEAVPNNIEDLIALVALYRPGPMENIPKYIACKHGREKPEFLHETIEPVVEDTYGVIIYQEQVMQIAQVFAGYSLGQADLLRRAMGKKIKAEMDAQREIFVNGAQERGVDKGRANYVFDLVDKFAGYGFNKAHSACYAFVAYQTAYLKANYPVEFMAASMSLDMANTDKLNIFKQELDRMGVALLTPDVNRSEVSFSVEPDADGRLAVRYALAAVKTVGREAMRGLVEEREANGPFADIWDFAERVDPRALNKRAVENLIRAGGFDSLSANRAQLLEAADLLLRFAQHQSEEKNSSQASLFGGGDAVSAPRPQLPAVAPWNNTELLAQEFDAVGFYLSAHPLDDYAAMLKKDRVVTQAELPRRVAGGGSHFRIAGTVLRKQERKNSRNNPYAFVQLSDQTGMYEITVFSEELSAKRDLLEPGRSLIMHVDARLDGDSVRLTAREIEDIEAASLRAAAGLRVFLNDEGPLADLSALLEQQRKGRAQIALMLSLGDIRKDVEIMLPGGFALTPRTRGAIKAIPGVIDVHDL